MDNVQGSTGQAQHDLAWIAKDNQTPLLAERMLNRQRRAIANQRAAKATPDKTMDLFKNGPHDAGLYQSGYNEHLYSPWMQKTYQDVSNGNVNAAERQSSYGDIDAGSKLLKNESDRLKSSIALRKEAEPNYEWGRVEENAAKAANELLKQHITSGQSVNSFSPDYNDIVAKSIQSSHDFVAPKIGKMTLDNGLTGSRKMTVTNRDSKGNTFQAVTDVPSFVILGKNKRGIDEVVGLDHPIIEQAFLAQPGGRAYLSMRENELLKNDPNYATKFQAFQQSPEKLSKLRYENIIQPAIGDPLAAKNVSLSRSNELAKTSDDDLEEEKLATPIPGELRIMKPARNGSPGGTEYKLPTLSFALTSKEFQQAKGLPQDLPLYRLNDRGDLVPISERERINNKGLADPKIDIVTVPMLRDKKVYYMKDGKAEPVKVTKDKGAVSALSPDYLDRVKKHATDNKLGDVYINASGFNQPPNYIKITSGKDIMDMATPDKPWVNYEPYAQITMQGVQGGFNANKKEDVDPMQAAMEMAYEKKVQKAKENGDPIPARPASLGSGTPQVNIYEDEKYSGSKGYKPALVPLNRFPGYVLPIQRRLGVDKWNQYLQSLKQQTYDQGYDQFNGNQQNKGTGPIVTP